MVKRPSPESGPAPDRPRADRARVCIVTTGQPSTNPRVLKEADALSDAGYSVTVIGSYWSKWAVESDLQLLRARRWKLLLVGGQPQLTDLPYWQTRVRHRLARLAAGSVAAGVVPRGWALARVAPELSRAAARTPADLYIAHYPPALPAAGEAAVRGGARLAYDLEDFHPGEGPGNPEIGSSQPAPSELERTYLGLCSYVSAASPGIASGYHALYGIPLPHVVLNVFPLSDRPRLPRARSSGDLLSLYWYSQTIGPERGLEDAMGALSHLVDLPVTLHLRGDWQSGYRAEMGRLARELGVPADRLRAHPPAPAEEMVRLAAAHDVGLALEHPDTQSRDVCLTNKLFTYVLAGAAVAGTATSGQSPVLEELGKAAVTYRPGDAAGLAAGIRRWATDCTALTQARRSAWDLGTHKYNWDLEKRKFLALVSRALSS